MGQPQRTSNTMHLRQSFTRCPHKGNNEASSQKLRWCVRGAELQMDITLERRGDGSRHELASPGRRPIHRTGTPQVDSLSRWTRPGCFNVTDRQTTDVRNVAVGLTFVPHFLDPYALVGIGITRLPLHTPKGPALRHNLTIRRAGRNVLTARGGRTGGDRPELLLRSRRALWITPEIVPHPTPRHGGIDVPADRTWHRTWLPTYLLGCGRPRGDGHGRANNHTTTGNNTTIRNTCDLGLNASHYSCENNSDITAKRDDGRCVPAATVDEPLFGSLLDESAHRYVEENHIVRAEEINLPPSKPVGVSLLVVKATATSNESGETRRDRTSKQGLRL